MLQGVVPKRRFSSILGSYAAYRYNQSSIPLPSLQSHRIIPHTQAKPRSAIFTVFCILAWTIFSGLSGVVHGENLLVNGDFNVTEGDKPAGWDMEAFSGNPTFSVVPEGRETSSCVKIAAEEGVDAAWKTLVNVKPKSLYRVRGWIRTENVSTQGGRGALFNVHGKHGIQTEALVGTQPWTELTLYFETGDETQVQLNCLLGGWGKASGTAWYDDVVCEEITPEILQQTVRVRAQEQREPVSPFIYGQFIEHLGRCIQGGIWAEMLEDRKFFYPVGSEESPWRIVGLRDAVTMDETQKYGETAVVRIQGPAGIRQEGLALRAGREYVGRIVLKGESSAGPVEIRLLGKQSQRQRKTAIIQQIGPGYMTYPILLDSQTDTDNGALEIWVQGKGTVYVAAVSLMPSGHVYGMRADTLALLKELNAPIYRWPGGNFVSGYHWRDGIGPRDKRPTRKNPAWKGIEPNDFGLDEFLMFCRTLNTEPYIVVNTGLGSVEEAVAELEYVNGAETTPMGRLRAQNGHPEPYGVTYWGVGNEMYGDWQLGHVPLEEYAKRHNAFAEALKAKDPNIKLVAVGDSGPWSEGMLTHCAEHIDYLSEHFYNNDIEGVVMHALQPLQSIRKKVERHRAYHQQLPSLQGKKIPIAMDEWNFWYGKELYGELGIRYFHRDALGIALGLHEYIRSSDMVFMANYAQTVNVIGCIKTTKTDAAFEVPALPLLLYRREFGVHPVPVENVLPPLDIVAAWTADYTALTLAVVNPTPHALEIPFHAEGARITPPAKRWLIQHNDPYAFNEPGKEAAVSIREESVDDIASLRLLPYSITLYRLNARKEEAPMTQLEIRMASAPQDRMEDHVHFAPLGHETAEVHIPVKKEILANETDFDSAMVENRPEGTPLVHLRLRPDRGEKLRRACETYPGQQLAVLYQGVLVAAPVIEGNIESTLTFGGLDPARWPAQADAIAALIQSNAS